MNFWRACNIVIHSFWKTKRKTRVKRRSGFYLCWSGDSGRGNPAPTNQRGNWVRVGDPNQAIFETFTTASPELLRAFIQNNPSVDMPESGRSQPAVIALANHLIDWVMTSHPIPEVRTALSVPYIVPVPEGDPQQNPPDVPEGVKFISTKFTPEQELEAVAKSVKGFVDSFADIPVEEQPTIAVLVPRNTRGVEVVNALRQKGIEPIELISSTSETRAAAGSLSHLLAYLADPQSARKLAKAYEVWRRDWREDMSLRAQVASNLLRSEENLNDEDEEGGASTEERRLAAASNSELLTTTSSILRKMVNVENFIAPSHAGDWLAGLSESEAVHVIDELGLFRVRVQRWLSAVTLPIDQLVLTLAQDVFRFCA
jgi:DNA helicase II / ATP-dependent DNA helicase PcrA